MVDDLLQDCSVHDITTGLLRFREVAVSRLMETDFPDCWRNRGLWNKKPFLVGNLH